MVHAAILDTIYDKENGITPNWDDGFMMDIDRGDGTGIYIYADVEMHNRYHPATDLQPEEDNFEVKVELLKAESYDVELHCEEVELTEQWRKDLVEFVADWLERDFYYGGKTKDYYNS